MNQAASVTTRDDGYVQDESSQWVAAAVGARAGEIVLDACAGPGGKATALAATGARVIGADLQPSRAGLVAKNAERLGHRLPVVACDATAPAFGTGSFDRVLVDAPCSGLGALRRRADARWRVTEDDVRDLASIQRDVLSASAGLVRPGGVLVYSVCTITAAESIDHAVPDGFDVVDRDGDDVLPALGPDWRPFGHGHRLLPHHADTDGMVIIRYRRRTGE
jgi:16S rRNA (cytosine967-C5)-methyltransferase